MQGLMKLMTEIEQAALMALKGCSMAPGSSEKRFIRQLSYDIEMSDKQRAWFWRIVHRYRNQHKRQMLTDYAKLQPWSEKTTKRVEEKKE